MGTTRRSPGRGGGLAGAKEEEGRAGTVRRPTCARARSLGQELGGPPPFLFAWCLGCCAFRVLFCGSPAVSLALTGSSWAPITFRTRPASVHERGPRSGSGGPPTWACPCGGRTFLHLPCESPALSLVLVSARVPVERRSPRGGGTRKLWVCAEQVRAEALGQSERR